MELKRITESSTAEARQLIALHSETFPQYERFQNTALLARLIDNASAMHFNALYDGSDLVGFFSYWNLGNACYIHFISVYPTLRNRGIGRQIMEWVSTHLHQPVFLESEVPFDEITERRLQFYKRNGFHELANDPETLASDRRGGHPQCFMGTQPVDNLEDYLLRIRELVYRATGEPV